MIEYTYKLHGYGLTRSFVDKQGREWVFPTPLRYRVERDKDGLFFIYDRHWDLSVGKRFIQKAACIRYFTEKVAPNS
jgi:hypothetical protein